MFHDLVDGRSQLEFSDELKRMHRKNNIEVRVWRKVHALILVVVNFFRTHPQWMVHLGVLLITFIAAFATVK